MRNHVLRSISFLCVLYFAVAIAGCDERSRTAEQVGDVADNEALRHEVADNPGQTLSGGVRRLPPALLGAVATSPEGCWSDYGPLVVKPTQFNSGWGRADFSMIVRHGDGYRIEAALVGKANRKVQKGSVT